MLHQIEQLLLSAMEPDKDYGIAELAKATGLDPGAVMKGIAWLGESGALDKTESAAKRIEITGEGKRYIERGFPENRVADLAAKAGSSGIGISSLGAEEKAIGLGWARKLGWVEIRQGSVVAKADAKVDDFAKRLREPESLEPELQGMFAERRLLKIEEKKTVTVKLAGEGIRLKESEKAGTVNISDTPNIKHEINTITSEVIRSKSWKDARVGIRRYNVLAPVEVPFAAKRHVVSRAIQDIKNVFVGMGFEEMEGALTELGFWNFDVLFQPQDHPARELADTFYLDGNGKITDRALLKRVKETHEKAWGGGWDEKEAQKLVLRTHTTAVSARYLAKLAWPASGGKTRGKGLPKKYFSIGKVFRNEAIDFKHLAEFYQIEGIIVDDGAKFSDLLGTLREFYSKLGFEKIRFRPSYFPYTEPSLEIEAYFEGRGKGEWLELGGAGMFRPEVSLPLCGRYPVLAFGLSLERPLMLRLGVNDIRELYNNNMSFLRESQL